MEFIIALLLGVSAGTFTGLAPGIHMNLVSVILLSFSSSLLKITSPITLMIFIVAMAITQTFLDFIPSIFLGAPDENTALSILPGHRFLLKGYAHSAVVLTIYGSLTGIILILFFTPFFIFFLPKIYPYLQRIMWLILIIVSGYLIILEKNNRFLAFVIFSLAGFLGIASLNMNLKEPLLPLFTGLFGASNLILSIKQKNQIPKQKIISLKKIKLKKSSFVKTFFASLIASPFTAFLPGLGSSQSAVIGTEITELNQREFLFLLGAINTIVMGLSFIALYSIQKTRTGAAAAISKLIPELTITHLFYIILAIILSGIIASLITFLISKSIAKHIHRFNYPRLSLIILITLVLLIFYFTGFLGLLIFIISTALGMTTALLNIKRMHLMGCLLIPTILFYLI